MTAKTLTLDTFIEDRDTFSKALHLAKTKYKDDPNIRTWLRIYEQGTHEIRTKQGKVKGIPLFSDFARENLIQAVRLREQRKVYISR